MVRWVGAWDTLPDKAGAEPGKVWDRGRMNTLTFTAEEFRHICCEVSRVWERQVG